MLRKLGKGLTAGVLIAAVGAMGLAASFVSKGTEKAQEVGASSSTTTKVDVSIGDNSWITWVRLRAYCSGSTWAFGSGSAASSSTESEYTNATSAATSGVYSFSSTAVTSDITAVQVFIWSASSSQVSVYTSCTIPAGGTYKVTIGSWSSTDNAYPLSVTNEAATTYAATVNFYVPYQLNSTYYDYKYWYTANGVSHSDASMGTATADSTQTGCNYVYSVSISGLISGTSFSFGIDLVELAASAGTDTYSGVWTVAAVTVSAAITDNIVAATDSWNSNVAAYEKGLADTWAASFISGTASACTSLAMTSSIWSTYSTSYSAMSTDSTILAAAQADFKSATASASSAAVLAAAAARYDFIYNKYATSLSLANFASRTTSSSALNVSGTLDNASSWTIGLIAGLGVILSGSYFFFLRKKKAE
jgi:hypothetical protein